MWHGHRTQTLDGQILLVGLILLRQIIPTAWNKNPTALIGGFVCPLPLRCWDNITYRFGIIFLKGYLLYFHLLTPFKVVMTFEKKQDQKDLLNLPLCKVMKCYINCFHCEGQNTTEFQPSKMAVVVLPQLASTCNNRELRSPNRVKPSRLGLNQPQPQVEVIQ